ncbi:MAG: pilus assembly protein CpaE [Nocardioides sp.]|nr:pilus assembly protein CpaE [Nocardioides sp.]
MTGVGALGNTGAVLNRELALALQVAGVTWSPSPGDSFMVPGRDLDDEVFVISEMVISSLEVPGGPAVLAFNGTTEWALDSLEAREALWLPREHQLRELLGEDFAALQRLAASTDGYAVTLADGSRHVDVTPEAAYARALLALLARR